MDEDACDAKPSCRVTAKSPNVDSKACDSCVIDLHADNYTQEGM